MRFSLTLLPAALLGVLVAATPAEAQRRGGPIQGDVGRYVNPILRGSGLADGYYGDRYDGRYYGDRYYDGRYYGDRYYDSRYSNYPNRGYYYPDQYQYQYRYGYQPSYQYYPGNRYESFYPNPNQFERQDRSAVRLTVRVPARAELWVAGQKTDQTGPVREFVSPSLEKGGTYHLRATWMENGQQVERERQLKVQPGQRYTVNFMTGGRNADRTDRPVRDNAELDRDQDLEQPDRNIEQPDRNIEQPDRNIEQPDRNIEQPDSSRELPEGELRQVPKQDIKQLDRDDE